MTDKAKALAMRDRLGQMAEEVMRGEPDMEDHVVACCLAVAIEEIEKWIYDNGWTPSVRPYIDDRDFHIPFPEGSENDPSQAGPPWDRKKVSIWERSPALRRLKKRGILSPDGKFYALEKLEDTPFEYWDDALRERFRSGKKAEFINIIRVRTGASIKRISILVDKMIATVPGWAVDTKPGNKCPSCGSEDVAKDSNPASGRLYECRDCGTRWG